MNKILPGSAFEGNSGWKRHGLRQDTKNATKDRFVARDKPAVPARDVAFSGEHFRKREGGIDILA